MKLQTLSLAAVALGGWLVVSQSGGMTSPAQAALTDSQFPPKTVADMIAICAPDKSDPMMTAAMNYCHGFAEGSVIVEMAHQTQRGGRKLFCLPHPAPASDAELTSFVAWANQEPQRLKQPAVDGMFLYLAAKYPCKKM
jgi:hypothetical protein